MFGCLKPAKAWKWGLTISLKPMTIGKYFKGEYDEKEYLEPIADRLAGFSYVYSAQFNAGAQHRGQLLCRGILREK
jgi:hypothetical protein